MQPALRNVLLFFLFLCAIGLLMTIFAPWY